MNWTLLVIIVVVVLGLLLLKRKAFIPAEEARRLLRQGAVVVDVRSPGEFDSGHLPGALNIGLGELESEVSRRIPDKSQVLLLHCLSGARSGIAQRKLKQLGYTNVHNLGSYGRAESIVHEVRN